MGKLWRFARLLKEAIMTDAKPATPAPTAPKQATPVSSGKPPSPSVKPIIPVSDPTTGKAVEPPKPKTPPAKKK